MDTNNLNPTPPPKATLVFMALSIFVISFATYRDILTYSFTATDTLTLIDVNRIQTPEKIVEIFNSPLLAGTSFEALRLFYRPVTSLTYGLDYFLWGLNPFGYHLTDLVFHMLVCILVFYTLLLLTNGRKAISWMSVIVFAIHPILVENVPAISRRQDTLVALFLLISLLLFLSAQKRRGGLFLILSLVAYCLALGSKETSILLPALLFVYLFLSAWGTNNEKKSIGFYVVQSIKRSLPYILVALAYIIWRGYVLGGIGGYTSRDVDSETIWFSIETIRNFFSSLIFPVAVSTFPAKLLVGGWGLCSLFLLVKLYSLNRTTIPGEWRLNGKSMAGAFRRFCAVVLFGSEIFRVVIFLAIWLLLSLSILLATDTFQFWYLYVPAIPFSVLVAIALIEPIQYIRNSWTGKFESPGLYLAVWSSFTAMCLVAYLFFFSPLFHKYDEWKDSGKLSDVILTEVSRVSAELPPGTTIHIYGLPDGIASYSSETHHVRSVGYLKDYSIKSWLDLTDPGGGFDVTASKYSVFETYPEDLNFDVQLQQDGSVLIVLEPGD